MGKIKHLVPYLGWWIQSYFAVLGAFWTVIEPYNEFATSKLELPLWLYVTISLFSGTVWFFVNGHYLVGYLKKEIVIRSNAFNTNIVVKFGDIFEQDGIIAISVNNFFDSVVDGYIIAPDSLHGQMLQKYWAGNIAEWDRQVHDELSGISFKTVNRAQGKNKRFTIGTTAETRTNDGKRFLCVALSPTDETSLQTKAESVHLLVAIRKMLKKARAVCGNKPLYLPLMGGGLSRVNFKPAVLLNLIIAAIFEENRGGRITETIYIILPREKSPEINLSVIEKTWS